MNQSVLVTGATANTGRTIAEKFAKEGYDVFVCSRSGEKAVAVAKELQIHMGFLPKDMRQKFLTRMM